MNHSGSFKGDLNIIKLISHIGKDMIHTPEKDQKSFGIFASWVKNTGSISLSLGKK